MSFPLRRLLPVRKVSSATVGAFTGQVIVYAIQTQYPEFGLTDDQGAMITVATTFIAGWLMPSKAPGRYEQTNEPSEPRRVYALPHGDSE